MWIIYLTQSVVGRGISFAICAVCVQEKLSISSRFGHASLFVVCAPRDLIRKHLSTEITLLRPRWEKA